MNIPFIYVPLISMTSCATLISLLYGFRGSLAVDHPNTRSLHTSPKPRIGGLAIIPSIILASFLGNGNRIPSTLIYALGLCLISYLDDLWGIPIFLRFAAHISFSFVWLMFDPSVRGLTGLLFIAVWFFLVWGINLYNFMDGIDGLSGGMAFIGFSCYAGVALEHHDITLAVISIATAGGALGFLFFNFPPAKVFLGDSGSIPLGFLAGSLGVFGWRGGVWPFWFPLVVFAPFIVDATATLTRRIHRKEKFWQAHREHYYQRLIQMGFSHFQVTIGEYAIIVLCSSVGFFLIDKSGLFVAISIGVLFLFLLTSILVIDTKWGLQKGSSLG